MKRGGLQAYRNEWKGLQRVLTPEKNLWQAQTPLLAFIPPLPQAYHRTKLNSSTDQRIIKLKHFKEILIESGILLQQLYWATATLYKIGID